MSEHDGDIEQQGQTPGESASSDKSSEAGEASVHTPLLQSDSPAEKSVEYVIARWLLLPLLFLIGHWCLFFVPDKVSRVCPTLWTPANRTPESLLPIPQNRVAVFDLAEKVQYFSEHCKEEASNAECKGKLEEAAKILGMDKPLTAQQLLSLRTYMSELDQQRTVADRVSGFFSFVNVLWLLGIIGIVGTVVPCIGFLIGPMLRQWAVVLWENVLDPAATFLHEIGAWEFLAYFLAFLLSVQGSRYPQGANAGIMVSLTGGLLFIPCWAYSTSLHMNKPGGDKDKFLMLSHFLVAGLMIPLALIHQSSLLGFLAVLAVYGGLGFIFLAFGWGFAIGFDSRDALNRCIVASVVLILAFTSFRVLGRNPTWVRPFVLGGMCLGNIMYFLAMLIATGGWRKSYEEWIKMQVVMALSLFFALLVGFVYSIPAMANTACTFLVLWLMEKQLQIDFRGCGIVVVFLNCVCLFLGSLWLNHHPEFIISMFDGKGLYS